MLKGFVVLVVIAMLLCGAAANCAEPLLASGLSVHAGLFVPTTSGSNGSYFTFGGSYKLSETLITETLVDLEYIAGKSKSYDIPLLFTVQTKATEVLPFYYGGGLGAYYCHAAGSSQTKLGIHAVAGYKFSDTIKGEIKYYNTFDQDYVRGISFFVSSSF